MASPSTFQQHLSPADMTMLDRVLRKVCISKSIARDSAAAERVAALLIKRFQQGANTEADLMTAFDGDFTLRVPVTRLSRLMGNALYGWERDDGTATSIYPRKGTHSMRYLDRLPTEPTIWLLAFFLVSIAGSFLYVALSSITY